MKETVILNDPKGSLDIRGNRTDTLLLLKEELLCFTFLREVGTTMRYQIGRNLSKDAWLLDRRFSNFVKHGYVSNEPLATQFEYILKLLAPGKYELALVSQPTDGYVFDRIDPEVGDYCWETYGGIEEVIATQSHYDEATLAEYTKMIQQGRQPIVIFLQTSDSFNTFIIDGHHKYLAYHQLKRPARSLIISRLDAKKIERAMGIDHCRQCGRAAPEFQRRFLEVQ